MRARWWMVVFGVVVVGHLLALYWPRVDVGNPPRGTDKVVHLLLFAIPVLAGALAFDRRWLIVVAALVIHAPVSEAVQSLALPDRVGSLSDLLANLVGVAVGVGVGWWARRLRSRPLVD